MHSHSAWSGFDPLIFLEYIPHTISLDAVYMYPLLPYENRCIYAVLKLISMDSPSLVKVTEVQCSWFSWGYLVQQQASQAKLKYIMDL